MVERPFVVTAGPAGAVRGIALLAHGGREQGSDIPGRLARPLLRTAAIARHLHRRGRRSGLLVAQLRYRVTGFNDGSPVDDVRWAIAHLHEQHGVSICLVGHSMGARASLLAAGATPVVGVAALAPWCPPSDPVDQLRDRTVLFVQGLADRTTVPRSSHEYALRARRVTHRCARFELTGTGHAMLTRSRLWHDLAADFVLGALQIAPLPGRIEQAMSLPDATACAVRL